MSTVAQLAVEALRRVGVDQLFCLPGVQNDDFFDALFDAKDIRPIVTRHEQGAAYMAFGASVVTGKPAAMCVVPGPGVLNAGAGLTSAYWSSGRVLALIGAIPDQLKGKGVGVLHELPDQTAVLEQVTKEAVYVPGGDGAVELVQRGLDALVSDLPRPVSIEIPVSAWRQEVDGALTDPVVSGPALDTDAVDRAAAVLAGAQNPLIVVGAGAWDASVEVTSLAETLQAPVTTRRQGLGVVDGRHPLSVPLTVGREFWAEADVVLGIGTRMEFPIMHWKTADDLTIIQLNLDPTELDRHGLGTIGVLGDAAEGCRALEAAVQARQTSKPADRTAAVASRRAAHFAAIAHLEPQLSMLAAIRDVLPDDGVIVEDVTQLTFAAHIGFEVRRPRTYVGSGPAGTLGAATAQAIGAQAALPGTPVLGITGDGGFLFTATELACAVQHNIPVTILVSDNASYGNVQRMQIQKFGADRTIATDLVNPDLVAFGQSFGVHTQRAETPDELRSSLEQAFAHDGPSLIVAPLGSTPDPWPYLRMNAAR